MIYALFFLLSFPQGSACRMFFEGGEGVQVERDCRIYEDLAAQHLMQATERPGITLHVSENPDCAGANAIARQKDKTVGCSFREKFGIEIRAIEDKPEYWLGLAMDGLDYANRLYLSRSEMQQKCQIVLGELANPELKKKYHAKVDYRETR